MSGCGVNSNTSGIQSENGGANPTHPHQLKDAWVRRISNKVADNLISRYEWLETNPQVPIISYGLYLGVRLAGAVMYGNPPTPEAGDICGKRFRDRVCCLCRGACEDWAPKNSSSKLIGVSLRLLAKDTRFRIVVAYADMRAGEIGTVYQATNWLYTGLTSGDILYFVDGRWRTGRSTRNIDWESKGEDYHNLPSKESIGKHRYVKFIGSDKWRFRRKLKYPVLTYPKREDYPEFFEKEEATFVQRKGKPDKTRKLWEVFG